jgi:hypothetical protein
MQLLHICATLRVITIQEEVEWCKGAVQIRVLDVNATAELVSVDGLGISFDVCHEFADPPGIHTQVHVETFLQQTDL